MFIPLEQKPAFLVLLTTINSMILFIFIPLLSFQLDGVLCMWIERHDTSNPQHFYRILVCPSIPAFLLKFASCCTTVCYIIKTKHKFTTNIVLHVREQICVKFSSLLYLYYILAKLFTFFHFV